MAESVAERYRTVTAGFTQRAEQVPADRWESPSPCAGWTARDVVRHCVDVSAMFLGMVGEQVPPGPSVDDEPAAAWRNASDAVQRALDDPAVATKEYDGIAGRMTFEQGISTFIVGDVLVHTWDLARAAGLDERLDAAEVHRMWESTQALPDDSFLRTPTIFGAKVDAPGDADEQTKYLAFTGRRA
jgi:uncharacterized protein (TIGR03086 family)